MSLPTGTFLAFPGLFNLPALVRKQRKLEKELEPLTLLAKEEKATRDAIDVLLVAAGFASNEGVSCNGYDVTHHARAGNSYISRDLLLSNGVDVETIDQCVDRYDTSYSATVKPTKGAAVRTR